MPKFQFQRSTNNGDAEQLFSDKVEKAILALSNREDKPKIQTLACALHKDYEAYKTQKSQENEVFLTSEQSSLAVKMVRLIDSYEVDQSASISAQLNTCCLRLYIPLRHPTLALNAYRINQLKINKQRAVIETKDKFIKSEQALISAIEKDTVLFDELKNNALLRPLNSEEIDLEIKEGDHRKCFRLGCF
jgi:hypothetical protein